MARKRALYHPEKGRMSHGKRPPAPPRCNVRFRQTRALSLDELMLQEEREAHRRRAEMERRRQETGPAGLGGAWSEDQREVITQKRPRSTTKNLLEVLIRNL